MPINVADVVLIAHPNSLDLRLKRTYGVKPPPGPNI